MKKILILLVIAALAGLPAACRERGTSGAMLSESEWKAVLRFSEPKTDNLLAGLEAGDYDVFSRDFDRDLLASMPRSEFETLKRDLDDRLGRYYSREVEGVVKKSDGSHTVIYSAVFGKSMGVLIRVTFQAGLFHRISGFSIEQ